MKIPARGRARGKNTRSQGQGMEVCRTARHVVAGEPEPPILNLPERVATAPPIAPTRVKEVEPVEAALERVAKALGTGTSVVMTRVREEVVDIG